MTDQTGALPRAAQFSISNVLGTSFAVIARNAVAFLLIAIVISIPSIVISRLVGVDPAVYESQINQQNVLYYSNVSTLGGLLSILVGLITSSLVTAALVYGTFQDLRGQKANLGDLLSRGFGSLLPVVFAAIAFGILVILGFVLLIVPGIILAVALWVYVPAIVVEKASVGASFKRSRELTKGHRWSILVLYIIVLAAVVAVEWVASSVLGLSLAALAYHWVAIPIQILYAVFIAVMSAVGYYYLRADKEGIAIGEIASVFD
jgi:hypothetical protein